MAENPLTRLPLSGQIGVAIAIAAAVLGAFYFFYWQPKDVEVTAKTAELEKLRAEIRALEVTASKLEEFKRDVAALEQRLETLKRVLPPAKETPDLMRRVQYLASQANLSIQKFTPGTTVNKEFYQEWPINIDVEGTYHNLALFFDRVGRLPRIVNMGDVKIKSIRNQVVGKTIQVSAVAKTFVYVEPTPTPPPPPGGARGRRPPARGR